MKLRSVVRIPFDHVDRYRGTDHSASKSNSRLNTLALLTSSAFEGQKMLMSEHLPSQDTGISESGLLMGAYGLAQILRGRHTLKEARLGPHDYCDYILETQAKGKAEICAGIKMLGWTSLAVFADYQCRKYGIHPAGGLVYLSAAAKEFLNTLVADMKGKAAA